MLIQITVNTSFFASAEFFSSSGSNLYSILPSEYSFLVGLILCCWGKLHDCLEEKVLTRNWRRTRAARHVSMLCPGKHFLHLLAGHHTSLEHKQTLHLMSIWFHLVHLVHLVPTGYLKATRTKMQRSYPRCQSQDLRPHGHSIPFSYFQTAAHRPSPSPPTR